MKNGGKSPIFLFMVVVLLIFTIGLLALFIISQNRKTSEVVTNDGKENQLKRMYFGDLELSLPEDWKISSFEKAKNSELSPYFCNFDEIDSKEDCTVYKLSTPEFDSQDVMTVVSYPVSFNFGGGSTPFVVFEEEVRFINEDSVLKIYYDVDSKTEEFNPEDENTWFADLNSIQYLQVCSSGKMVCLSADLRNLVASRQKDFLEKFTNLVSSL